MKLFEVQSLLKLDDICPFEHEIICIFLIFGAVKWNKQKVSNYILCGLN